MKYADDEFEFKKCSLSDLDSICEIQNIAFANLTNKDLLRRNTRETLGECLEDPHYTMGVFHDKRLVAFAILYDGGTGPENIGHDIGIPESELNNVINFKLVIVLPEYRGNKLQQKLIFKLEQIARENGKRLICATVSPLNLYSYKNFEEAGFKFHSNKTKYNGLSRNIYYKEI